MRKLTATQTEALTYWANPTASRVYKGGNKSTLAALIARDLIRHGTWAEGGSYVLTDAGREWIRRQIVAAKAAALLQAHNDQIHRWFEGHKAAGRNSSIVGAWAPMIDHDHAEALTLCRHCGARGHAA